MYQLLNTCNANQEFVSVTLQKVVRCSARSLTEGKFFCVISSSMKCQIAKWYLLYQHKADSQFYELLSFIFRDVSSVLFFIHMLDWISSVFLLPSFI